MTDNSGNDLYCEIVFENNESGYVVGLCALVADPRRGYLVPAGECGDSTAPCWGWFGPTESFPDAWAAVQAYWAAMRTGGAWA